MYIDSRSRRKQSSGRSGRGESQDAKTNEHEHRSGRQVTLNLPEISAPKVPIVQTLFKRKDLELTQDNIQNPLSEVRKSGGGLTQINMATRTNQLRGAASNNYISAEGQKGLPNIILEQNVQKDYGGHDYVSLGSRIQNQIKEYNTTNPAVSQQQQSNRRLKNSSVQPISRGMNSRPTNLLTPTHAQGVALANVNTGQTPQTTTFENYLRKVIKSVSRRKNKAHQSQRLGDMISLGTSTSRTGLPRALNNNSMAFQNFSNQILSNTSNLVSQSAIQQNDYETGDNRKEINVQDQGRLGNLQIELKRQRPDEYMAMSLKSSIIPSKHSVNNSQIAVIAQQEQSQQQPKATEQVAFLLREAQKKDKIFIPLEKSNDPNSNMMYKELKNAPENHAGIVVFSKQGFVTVGKERNATSDFISNEQFIEEGVSNLILKDIPFFKKFQSMRFFKQWKYIMRWNAYSRKRQQLADNWIFAKPVFAENYYQIVTTVNHIRTLPFMEIKPNVVYGKKQQATLDDRCTRTLEKSKLDLNELMQSLKEFLQNLKATIEEDDHHFEQAIKENRVQALIKQKREEHVMFSKARRQKEVEEDQLRLQRMRHTMYDKLVEIIIRFFYSNLIELLFENKKQFRGIFTSQSTGPQFEVSICFNQKGSLDTDPSMEDHHVSFLLIFENMEKAVYQNTNLMEFINDLNGLFYKSKYITSKTIFQYMREMLESNVQYKYNNKLIFEALSKDIERCRDYLEQFRDLQEIFDFTNNWNHKKDKQVSLEMTFYKDTWSQMDKYTNLISKIPTSNTKLGTILVETLSLKKYLSELPKQVIDSIRNDVTKTMEDETKTLREELSKCSEILDQLPTSLNVYVENLPKLQKHAAEGLNQNKDTMEKIMQSSSMVLSKKIKAFEKKYIETYLQDKSRLEDCGDTLEELFKRSKAIHEIRSKVILYREFLKLLYEDDINAEQKLSENKLQCTDDYEFVAELHKQTVKLWKMLLYWKKRRQMCYNTPFLQLDSTKIIRSINKVNKFFEDKLQKNEFLREKSRPLSKVVIHQVKDTSLIIEFLKDLRKESLKQRHWLQIFNLIKAPHLKNSNTFTIVNLREYHIQNYRDEINKIIEHANSELKCEELFQSIQKEWAQLELKIIPYKESRDSYILINSDALSNAIEDNLTTLEVISQSKYAAHVKGEIEELIKSLKTMLKNLEIWIEAQKYWINLDPIFQSQQLQEFFGKSTQEFLELRNQFKRIMWSSFKNPRATYNLMINSRIEIFKKLIQFFSQLQKKVNEYLEQRRIAFPRFFFLSDAQFLEFLTLANSNQDFNDFINVLFQGAQKLYINKILGKKPLGRSDEDGDKHDGLLGSFQNDNIFRVDQGENLNQFENEDEQQQNTPYLRNAAVQMTDQNRAYEQFSPDSPQKYSDEETLSQEGGVNKFDSIATSMLSDNERKRTLRITGNQSAQEEQSIHKSSYQVLGMISQCKELFLFENAVPMNGGVECWLKQVEVAMQETIAKQINYAVSSFPKQALDEWILDYPQQVVLTTIQLILSHEINELLLSTTQNKLNSDQSEEDSEDSDQVYNQNSPRQQYNNISTKRGNLSSDGHGTFSKLSSRKNISNAEEDEDLAMKDYQRRKDELKAQQQAEEDEEKLKLQEEMKEKIEANEVPRDAEKEKRKFVDQMFGKDFQMPQQAPTLVVELQDSQIQSKIGSVVTEKAFKDNIMSILQKKSFQGLFLRLQFWISQITKSLHGKAHFNYQDQPIEIQLNSVQTMVMKSIVSFLIYQRDLVELLISKNVTDINDFDWQSQIRFEWTGLEPGCKVQCGTWQTYQQNEYIGSQPRLTLTPLNNRYFVFMSAALREKSAILFKCTPSHQQASDVFEEFANICTIPSRIFNCTSQIQMKTLMQLLNGAALACVWIYYEHLDLLPFIQLQAFNKEIQMVQQQFIISELSSPNDIGSARIQEKEINKNYKMKQQRPNNTMNIQESISSEVNTNNKYGMPSLTSMKEGNTNYNKSMRTNNIKMQQDSVQVDKNKNSQSKQIYTKPAKACFGVFGSISHTLSNSEPKFVDTLLFNIQSAFRVLTLNRPSEDIIFKIVLKANGFENYELISRLCHQFLEYFYSERGELIKLQNKNQHDSKYQLNQQDLKIIVKVSNLMKQQEIYAFSDITRQKQKREAKKVIMSQSKTRDQKLDEIEKEDLDKQQETDKIKNIELHCISQALNLVFKQKFSSEWQTILDQLNHYDVQQNLSQIINKGLAKIFDPNMVQTNLHNQDNVLSTLSNNEVLDDIFGTTNSAQLVYAQERTLQENQLTVNLQSQLQNTISLMNLDIVGSQVKQCMTVIDYMRRMKGIAIIGPTCSGKTEILQIVSNALSSIFGITMRTSLVNPVTLTSIDLYGTTNAFADNDHSFNKSSIFHLILEIFEKEKQSLTNSEKQSIIQSIFFNTCQIDSSIAESMTSFLTKANKRQREDNNDSEFLLSLASKQVAFEGLVENISISLPNSNVVTLPSDLYLFFETESLKDSTPAFTSQVGIIVTDNDNIGWQNVFNKLMKVFLKKNSALIQKYKLQAQTHLNECFKEFLEPFIEKLIIHQKVSTWQFLEIKSSIIQLFTLLNAMFQKLTDIAKEKQEQDDEQDFLLNECQRDVFWSSILCACTWSIGSILNKEMRKAFEEQYVNYRRKFNIAIGGPGRQRFTLFDIYFDPDRLQWDMLTEKLEYKLKLHFDPMSNVLLIPTIECSQAYYMMDTLYSSMKPDDLLDKHFRLLGPSGTSKSTILSTFMKKNNEQYQSIWIPMSSYVTISKMKKEIEGYYQHKRKNHLEPINIQKKIVIVIDDLHLQGNINNNILEFIRTWCISKGYYDVPNKHFKKIGNFATAFAENSEYRRSTFQHPQKSPLHSRFLFYTNTLYQDEPDQERFKVFAQHWLTSKMWNTSKIVNKYYILITNSLMHLLEKLKRQDNYHNSSFVRLNSFHLFAKYCQNLVNYTLISDDSKEIIVKGLREEDSAADMMSYEFQRTYGDRILMPSHRISFLQKVSDICKSEFLCASNMTAQHLDSLLLGNYHERRAGAHVKYLNVGSQEKEVREQIRQKLRSVSNNHFLELFLDAPNGLKEVFRISRILYKEMQHAIIVGPPGSGKHEYLQLSSILNDAFVFELNVSRFGEPLQFEKAFKDAIVSAINLNKFSYLVINDMQLRDPTYIDFTHNFIQNICNKENCVLYDEQFKQALINMEIEIHDKNQQQFNKGKENSFNPEILLIQAVRKIQKNIHIVILINDYQSYYEWISLFPGLEVKCEILHMDELSNEGYRQMAQEFFSQRDTDNTLLNEQQLSKSLVQVRQIVKNKILSLFYSNTMLQYTANEEFFNSCIGEQVFNSDEQLHRFMYNDGNFKVQDMNQKEYYYNLPLQLSAVYKSRFIMFIELFRFLYDFLSLNLVIRNNYYETFIRKASEFREFFKDIKSTKSVLHSESNQVTYKLASIKDKINSIQSIISDKENNIARRKKDISDLEIEIKNNRDELNSVIQEKDTMLDQILEHFEKINGSEFSFVVTTSYFKEHQQALLDILALIIENDSRRKQYNKNDFDMYFLNREELINILNERRNIDYDNACFQMLKEYINTFTVNDYKDKPLFQQLFNYIMELYRKLNVRNTMANTYAKIKEIKDVIDSNYFSINYSGQFIDDKKEEMQGYKDKLFKCQEQEKNLSKRIEEAEISHMRTEHIFEQVDEYADKIRLKSQNIKIRIETLLGDCIVLAASVTYLGAFSVQEKIQLRKEMIEYIEGVQGLKCNACWNEGPDNYLKHTRLFKQILKEYGLRQVILPHNFSTIVSPPVLYETIFGLVFAPSCPLIVDPTGHLQEYVHKILLTNLKSKVIYGSDLSINSKIEQTLRSSQFALLNDINDGSKDTFGLCQEQPILHRLSNSLYNGFDFDYAYITKLKELHTLGSFYNAFNGVNKRIAAGIPEFENLSFYQVQIFSPRFEFMLNLDYMSKMTLLVAMDTDKNITYESTAWIEIKEIMLKQFLPDEYKRLQIVKAKIQKYDSKQAELNKSFENAFLVANQDTLQDIGDYSLLKQSVEDIRHSVEERTNYKKQFQEIINNHNLLTQYSNYILIMYLSLKKLSKIATGEITYSWSMYLNIIESIFTKIVNDLGSNLPDKQKDKDKQQATAIVIQGKVSFHKKSTPAAPAKNEFSIDEEFFSTTILPAIHSTITSGIKQHNVSLFNLVLAINIALKNKDITENEKEYFYKQLFQLKDFYKWRLAEHDFVDIESKIEKTKYFAIKRELMKLYPEQARKIIESIDKELGQTYSYKKASLFIYSKLFQKSKEGKELALMSKINIGFLCPDHEFKSKLCQLVYEQLAAVFTFNEEFTKLHAFVKAASWQQPIALFCQNSINIINTICSIASFYGVGLEVLRTDPSSDSINKEVQTSAQNLIIENQLVSYQETNYYDVQQRLNKEVVRYEDQNKFLSLDSNPSKQNWDQAQLKNQLKFSENSLGYNSGSEQNPLKIIEQCAISGSWVFISTIKFPQYWHKMTTLLEHLQASKKINGSFRLFVDLQGYCQNEIPDSFLFNSSIVFYLSEKNNEDMEGFNDIWANIINENILQDMSQYHVTKIQPPSKDQLANTPNNKDLELQKLQQVHQQRDSLINNAIKNPQQRDLYREYLQQQQLDKSNTLNLGSDLEKEELKPSQDNSYINSSQMSMSQEQSQVFVQQINRIETFKSSISKVKSIYGEAEGGGKAEEKGQPKISRINSINVSAELSRGESALIYDLNSQMDLSPPRRMVSEIQPLSAEHQQEEAQSSHNDMKTDVNSRHSATNIQQNYSSKEESLDKTQDVKDKKGNIQQEERSEEETKQKQNIFYDDEIR